MSDRDRLFIKLGRLVITYEGIGPLFDLYDVKVHAGLYTSQ